jgi:hypothetical protein
MSTLATSVPATAGKNHFGHASLAMGGFVDRAATFGDST